MLNFKVDDERCIKCGKCVTDCPAMCITMEKGECPTIPDEDQCLRCQHCLAVCPTAALSILDMNPDNSLELQYALPTARSMETLIKGRRSTRKYKKQSLDSATINTLLETAWHAPTGTNAQAVHFTTTTTREVTAAMGEEIYAKVGAMLEGTNPDEDDMARTYLRKAHGARTEYGMDIILRGAPHILIASAPKTIPLPKEDTLIALTTFELMAQSMGVGTLWNGILKWCLCDFFPEIATKLGVPEDHQVGYTMIYGRPAVQYHRTVQRTMPKMNLVDTY